MVFFLWGEDKKWMENDQNLFLDTLYILLKFKVCIPIYFTCQPYVIVIMSF